LGLKEYCGRGFLVTGKRLKVGKKALDGGANHIKQVEIRLWNQRTLQGGGGCVVWFACCFENINITSLLIKTCRSISWGVGLNQAACMRRIFKIYSCLIMKLNLCILRLIL